MRGFPHICTHIISATTIPNKAAHQWSQAQPKLNKWLVSRCFFLGANAEGKYTSITCNSNFLFLVRWLLATPTR